MWKSVKEEFASYSRKEIFFIVCAMLCGFFICTEYAIIRPVSNSLFISSYTAAAFPYAWLVTVPLNFFVVYLYNRFLPRLGCQKMFLVIIAAVGLGNLFCALFIKKISLLPFFFYVWKEIYIMLLFQQLWSVIHATIEKGRARYLYGILFAIGGLGGVVGSLVPGFGAVKMGSENLLFFSLPICALLYGIYRALIKNSRMGEESNPFPVNKDSLSAWKNIVSSKALLFILLIVIFMQMASTMIDFQFNTALGEAISEKDLRTEYAGRIMSLVNTCTIFLQLFGSYFLLRFLNIKQAHFAIPAWLGLNSLAFLFVPAFGMISFAFVSIKAFDFSLFGIIKEMLYLPLKTDDKFRAKAFIDVFAYRSAKAFASFLILFLQFVASSSLLSFLTWGTIALFVVWGTAVVKMLQVEGISTFKADS